MGMHAWKDFMHWNPVIGTRSQGLSQSTAEWTWPWWNRNARMTTSVPIAVPLKMLLMCWDVNQRELMTFGTKECLNSRPTLWSPAPILTCREPLLAISIMGLRAFSLVMTCRMQRVSKLSVPSIIGWKNLFESLLSKKWCQVRQGYYNSFRCKKSSKKWIKGLFVGLYKLGLESVGPPQWHQTLSLSHQTRNNEP